MVSAIASSQRQEGIEISEERAEEVYKIVFEEPPVAFFRLAQAGDDREHLLAHALSSQSPIRFDVPRRALLAIDGAPLAYWVPGEVMQLFRALPALYPSFGEAQQGVITGEDAPYFRFFWEVAPRLESRPWKPLHKGGDFSRFFYDADLVIDWSEIAQQQFHRLRDIAIYFRPGLTWPRRTQRGFNVRAMPEGCVYSDKGPAFLLKDAKDFDYLLGILNSSMAEYLCRTLMSFGSYELRAVHRLPIPRPSSEIRARIASTARRIHDAKATWNLGNEISVRFREPWVVTSIKMHPQQSLPAALDAVLTQEIALDSEIQSSYSELEAGVFDAYGLSRETRDTVLKDLGVRPPELIWPQMEGKSTDQKRMEHVWRLLSFCSKRVIESDSGGIVPLVKCSSQAVLEERVLGEIGKIVGTERLHELEGEVASELRKRVPGYKRTDSIDDWLTNAYFEYHVRLYKSRPIYWHLASSQQADPSFGVIVHYHRFGKDALRKLRGSYVRGCLDRFERELGHARNEKRTEDTVELQQKMEDVRTFEKKLQALDEGEFPIRVPWKDAAKQPKGWEPDIDAGVKVNILPLQTAGLLRIAKVVSAASEEDE